MNRVKIKRTETDRNHGISKLFSSIKFRHFIREKNPIDEQQRSRRIQRHRLHPVDDEAIEIIPKDIHFQRMKIDH